MTLTAEQATALRRPFPPESIGKLPKGGAMLDYAGHAAVTDRLLAVDPEWTWEPFAIDANGLPAFDTARNLWIRLTVCGVTRIGVGDGKSAKECIGDAIRNAAMRFGVALDLWAKEDLVEFAQAATAHRTPAPAAVPVTVDAQAGQPLTDAQSKRMHTLLTELDVKDRDKKLKILSFYAGREVLSSKDLTRREAADVIDALAAKVADAREVSA